MEADFAARNLLFHPFRILASLGPGKERVHCSATARWHGVVRPCGTPILTTGELNHDRLLPPASMDSLGSEMNPVRSAILP